MKIEWNKVTGLSQAAAIVLFVLVFGLGFWIGKKYENKALLGEPNVRAKFVCPDKTLIRADFYDRLVYLDFPGTRTLLPQTISAGGARYANKDESLIFWNIGDSARVEVNGQTTFENCLVQP